MAVFEYVALDANGRRRKGVVEGDGGRQARQALRDQGLSPLSVTATEGRAANGDARPASNQRRRWRWGRGMSPLELALVTRQLATLIAAGLPVEQALGTIAQQTGQRRVSTLMMNVRGRVLEGHALAAALAEYPLAFDSMYRSTVAAGEQSGFLHVVLDNLADHAEQRYAASRDVQMALFYPIILFVVSAIIIAGLMAYVVPNIIEMFDDMGHELPLLTTMLIDISGFLNAYWWMLGLAVAGAVLGARWLFKQPTARLAWHRRKLKLPLVARIVRSGNASRYTGTLAILTGSGVALVDAMRIATEVVTNMWMKQRLGGAVERVSEGSSLGAALESAGDFPPMVLHMVASGEASGELDAMLTKVADYQQQELTRLVGTLVQLFQPIMLLVMAGLVLMIVLAILVPILGMNQLVL